MHVTTAINANAATNDTEYSYESKNQFYIYYNSTLIYIATSCINFLDFTTRLLHYSMKRIILLGTLVYFRDLI